MTKDLASREAFRNQLSQFFANIDNDFYEILLLKWQEAVEQNAGITSRQTYCTVMYKTPTELQKDNGVVETLRKALCHRYCCYLGSYLDIATDNFTVFDLRLQ